MKIVCTQCGFEISAQCFKRHTQKCDGSGPRRFKPKRPGGKAWAKGKNYEELYGSVRSSDIKSRIGRIDSSGVCSDPSKEIERRSKISKSMKGNRNWIHSITKSGRGQKGYYQGYYFMSSWELAFIIFHLEHGHQIQRNWKSFDYQFEGATRKFIPDFLVDGHYMEVKGWQSTQWKAKLEAFPFPIEVFDAKRMKPILNYVIDRYGSNFVQELRQMTDSNRRN